ncbi:MAG: delta-60 repeat domain-containing protein, partial [Tepidisphaeraceae bacterium]
MTTRSVLRNASARIEALELRQLFSGEIDHSFGTGGLVATSSAGIDARAIAVQADGKIVVAGSLHTKGTTAGVARYLANGELDPTFGTKGVVTVPNAGGYAINGIAVEAGGKIFIEGPTFIRLTSTGAFDKTFGGGDGIQPSILASDRRNGGVNGNAVLADGSFFELSNAKGARPSLYKYKPDGSIDTSFGNRGSYNLLNLPNGNSSYDYGDGYFGFGPGVLGRVGGVAVDAQGRVYISYDDQFPNDALGTVNLSRVARLTSAGALDTTFGTQGAYIKPGKFDESGDDIGAAIAVTSDGRILYESDEFSDAFSAYHIVALDSNGTLINTIGTDPITKITPAKDGSVYVVEKTFDDFTSAGEYSGPVGNSYASVLHLTKDLNVDRSYSADREGVAGFRTMNSLSAADGAITPQGNFVLLGIDPSNAGELAQFDGPSKATRVTYQLSAGKLVVNGSGSDDHFTATTDTGDTSTDNAGALIVHFDS